MDKKPAHFEAALPMIPHGDGPHVRANKEYFLRRSAWSNPRVLEKETIDFYMPDL